MVGGLGRNRTTDTRISLTPFGLALYGQISVIAAGSAVSGAVTALRQAVGRWVGCSAPRPALAIRAG